jgi:hypothetical protein
VVPGRHRDRVGADLVGGVAVAKKLPMCSLPEG